MPRKLSSPEILEKWKKYRAGRTFPIVVILDNLRSAYNVGSIFRTCECAGIEKLILCGITPCPPHKGIEKTALGTTNTLPWEYELSVLSTIEKLKKEGYTVASLEITDKSIPLTDIKKKHFPLALIIGNEVYGVSEAVLSASDLIFEIPLYGKKESLNVAVSAGVALFMLIEKFKSFIL
ncbi:MAG: RNA methyltransferase [Caldimicrobium sp.]